MIWPSHLQVDPAGEIWIHPPVSQLHHSSHLLHQRLVLPPPDLVLLLSHEKEQEGFAQREEGRQIFHRQFRLETKEDVKKKHLCDLAEKPCSHWIHIWSWLSVTPWTTRSWLSQASKKHTLCLFRAFSRDINEDWLRAYRSWDVEFCLCHLSYYF